MKATANLSDLLADPARAADVPPAAIASVLTEVTGQEARLGAVKAILAARLAVPLASANGSDREDVVEDVHEVAQLVRRSVSWVRKNGHTLPGFRQPGGKRTRVAWSRRTLEEWAAQPTP